VMLRRHFLLTVAMLGAGAQAAAQGLSSKFDPRRDAVADVAHAVAQAAAEGKRVLVDVGGEWCAWCHILDRFIAAHDDVRSLIEAEFVWVKVNFSPANRNERLLSTWPPIPGYPHLFVLDTTGRVVRSQPTAQLERGNGYDEAKVMVFLHESRAPARARSTSQPPLPVHAAQIIAS
ncbi:MAG TPA: thioredoxin family protein, partial [Zeimonas sp.]